MDRKTVMSWLEGLAADGWRMFYSDSEVSNIAKAALELLKEQETQKFFVDESGKITPLPVVVRCNDCKHSYFADNRIPSEQENVCGRNGIVVTPDWFCADGERKKGR